MRETCTLAAVATELNLSLGTVKGWLKRSGPLVSAASRLLPDRWMLPGGKE